MATTNYSWNLPTVGGSEDTWGTDLNANWTSLDTLLGGTNATEFAILDGATVTTAELNILDGVTATAAEINLLDGVTATTTELNYVDGVTSAIQTQLDAKAPLASPALTGTPTAPTAAADTDTTQVATTAFVRDAVPDVLNASGSAPVYACRAWVNFNGTGTVAIRASGNVSSITDNGVGDYTVNFTTAIEDVNYAVTSSNPIASDGTKGAVGIRGGYDTAALLKTTSQVRIYTGATTTLSIADFQQIDIAVFR